jgi:hypothetical protein
MIGMTLGLLALACNSTIEAPPGAVAGGSSAGSNAGTGTSGAGVGGSAGSGGVTGGASGTSGSAGTPEPGVFVPSPSRLRRLTSVEYKNSVVDLLGAGTLVTTELERDTALNNLTAIGASSLALSAPVTEQFETSALALSDALVKDTVRRQAVVECAPSGPSDETCLRTFLTTFGRRVFRRPLTPEEVELYAGVGVTAMTTLSDFWGGVRYTLAGLLQSPSFLYRSEFGLADAAAPDRRRLDGYELATRLSFLLWATTPDNELLDAAAAGTLSTPEGLAGQMARLLGSQRSSEAIVNVLSEMLRLAEVDNLVQLPEAYPQAASPTLGTSMRGETQAFLRGVLLDGDGDYRQLFTSTRTFLNAELAGVYGVAGISGTSLVSTELPPSGPRAGYLGHGSFLALNAKTTDTSPTFRGKFIIETLLCSAIEPPPNDVVTELPDKDPSQTKRDQLAVHQSVGTCAGCHSIMDPMGLALEHFDGIGAYRETDRGLVIDVSGEYEGVAFDGARELGEALANRIVTPEGIPEVADCLVRNLYRAATGHLELAGDEPVVRRLGAAFSVRGFRVKDVLGDLVASEGFQFVGLPE